MKEEDRQTVFYFALTFAISWGGIAAYVWAIGGISSLTLTEGLVIFGLMLLGPSATSLLLTARFDGVAGLRGLVADLFHWKTAPLMWALVLLTNVAALLAALGLASIVAGPAYTPGFALAGLVVGLVAATFEELGWTGFATKRMLHQHSPVKAGLVLGLIWACWHALADYVGNGVSMTVGEWILRFVIYWIVPLTAYRVLMTWVYSRTQSLLLAILAHASYTGWQIVLTPPLVTPSSGISAALVWYVPFAVILAGLVFLIIRIVPAGSERRAQRGHPQPAARRETS